MFNLVYKILFDAQVYAVLGFRFFRGQFAMRKPTVKGEIPAPSEDHRLVLEALARLEGRIGRGATRTEIRAETGRPELDISAILGSLHIAGLVLCEGTSGYPPAPCWRVKA